MLDASISGQFREEDYDESECSKLEVKWKRFLSASKLSKQKIEEERTNMQAFVTDISHQTKTPIANMLLYTQLLEEQNLDEESTNMVKEIARQSEKLEFLIQSLVKLSRLEAETIQLEPKEQEVLPLLEKICEQAKNKATQKNMTVFCINSKEESRAAFDKKWTAEALHNILDNAIKYAPMGSKVVLSIQKFTLFLCIEIKDEGPGILEEEIPRIFERFYRGRDVHDQEGIGIGLHLARRMIEGQGGYIKVLSKLGEGSRFQIYLPKE